ncbi:MAG: hypothetical protein QM768_03105 [Agriterribacter sp.]
MNISKLTDYQLYVIIQNSAIDKDIRNLANNEFNKRNLSIPHIKEIISKHESQLKPPEQKSLKIEYKILLIIFPFFLPIQSIFAGKLLVKGEKQKWKEYWLYISIGYLIWTIIIICFARLFPPALR